MRIFGQAWPASCNSLLAECCIDKHSKIHTCWNNRRCRARPSRAQVVHQRQTVARGDGQDFVLTVCGHQQQA